MLSLLISLLLSFLIGWVSQRMGMCLVKAVGRRLADRGAMGGIWHADRGDVELHVASADVQV